MAKISVFEITAQAFEAGDFLNIFLMLVSDIFYQFFIFNQMIALQKL